MKTGSLALSAWVVLLVAKVGAVEQADTTPPLISTPMIGGNPNHKGNHVVTWSATDAGSSVVEIQVQRADNGGGFVTVKTLPGSDTSWQQYPKVTQGTYLYRILAKDAAGNSATSVNSTTVFVDMTPSVVTSFTITPNPAIPGAHTLSWNIVEAGGGSTLLINVYRSANGGGFVKAAKLTTPTMGWQQLPAVSPGTYVYKILVYDTAYNHGWSPEATIVVGSAPVPPTDTTATAAPVISQPAASVGIPFSLSIATAGGVFYVVSAGTLPPGLSLSPLTGQISGVPTAPGAFSFTVTTGPTTQQNYTLTVNGAIQPLAISWIGALPSASQGLSYAHLFEAVGGFQPHSWAVVSGTLPNGLTLSSSSGLLWGIASQAGSFTFTIGVTDGSLIASKSFNLTVSPTTSALAITSSYALQDGIVQLPLMATGMPFSTTFFADEATWSVSSGSPPSGLALDSTGGKIIGTPTQAGTHRFVLRATDGLASAYRAAHITVAANGGSALSILPANVPGGSAGTPYSATFAAAGSAAAFSWVVVGGALPPGLTLNPATGEISGTPSDGGTWDVIVQIGGSSRSETIAIAVVASGGDGGSGGQSGGGGGGSCGCVGLEALLMLLGIGLRKR